MLEDSMVFRKGVRPRKRLAGEIERALNKRQAANLDYATPDKPVRRGGSATESLRGRSVDFIIRQSEKWFQFYFNN